MSNVNTVSISGALTRDAELKRGASGQAYLRFTLANHERSKDPATGRWTREHTNFVDCKVWGPRAEALAPILKRGVQAVVTGRLRFSRWTDSKGVARSGLEVAVGDIQLCSPAPRAEGAGEAVGTRS